MAVHSSQLRGHVTLEIKRIAAFSRKEECVKCGMCRHLVVIR